MKTLYELVLDLADCEMDEDYSTTKINKIVGDVNSKVKTKLGNSDYQKFEAYCLTNRKDSDLKELANEIAENEQLASLGDFFTHSEVKAEIKLGYKITIKLYNGLDNTQFDANRALLDYWDN